MYVDLYCLLAVASLLLVLHTSAACMLQSVFWKDSNELSENVCDQNIMLIIVSNVINVINENNVICM